MQNCFERNVIHLSSMPEKEERKRAETEKKLPMLAVRELVVHRRSLWRNTEPLLNNLTFSADREEVVALCGEEGSGRSLLSRMILRIPGSGARISSGKIFLNQVEISNLGRGAMAPIRRKQLFYFSSEIRSLLNSEMLVQQYLKELIILSNRSTMYGNEATGPPVFYQVGIVDPEKIIHAKCGDLKPVTVLRIMLISAIFVGAKVIIADDPTAQLDDLDRPLHHGAVLRDVGMIEISDLVLVLDQQDRAFGAVDFHHKRIGPTC